MIYYNNKRKSKGYCKLTAILKVPAEADPGNGAQCHILAKNFPHKDGVHATISSRTLLTGLAIYYNKHCKVAFVTCAQVHEEGDNSLSPRTSEAIAL